MVCERCKNQNKEAREYRLLAKKDTRSFCDDCARFTHETYPLSPTPPSGAPDAAPEAQDEDKDSEDGAPKRARSRKATDQED